MYENGGPSSACHIKNLPAKLLDVADRLLVKSVERALPNRWVRAIANGRRTLHTLRYLTAWNLAPQLLIGYRNQAVKQVYETPEYRVIETGHGLAVRSCLVAMCLRTTRSRPLVVAHRDRSAQILSICYRLSTGEAKEFAG